MVRAVLADDEEFVRYFLKSVVESLSYEVVGEVDKGDALLEVMKKTNPDILFLDINMPNLTGTEFLEKYASQFPKTCIIILTSASLMKLMGESSLTGANCFLRKDTPLEEMIEAIEKTWLDFKKENRE